MLRYLFLLVIFSLTTPIAVLATSNVNVKVKTTVNGKDIVNESYSSESEDDSVHVMVNDRVQANTHNQMSDDPEDDSSDNQPQTVRERVQERLEKLQNDIASRRCRFMKNFYRRIANRYSNFTTRLNSRTAKLKAAGKDVSGAEDLLSQIEDQTQAIDQSVQQVSDSCDAIQSADDVRQSIQDLKTSLSNFRDQAKTMRQLLVDTLHELISLGPIDTEPTPTPTNST